MGRMLFSELHRFEIIKSLKTDNPYKPRLWGKMISVFLLLLHEAKQLG
ncbi:hypothetical protein EMIT091MI3_10523 [Kosakonia quasisacchari]